MRWKYQMDCGDMVEIYTDQDTICLKKYDDYEELPSQYDIHEYSIMKDFVESIADNRKRAILDQAINGRGAFRRFKDNVYDLGLEESWFVYKYAAYCKIAIRWCEDSDISYEFKNKKK